MGFKTNFGYQLAIDTNVDDHLNFLKKIHTSSIRVTSPAFNNTAVINQLKIFVQRVIFNYQIPVVWGPALANSGVTLTATNKQTFYDSIQSFGVWAAATFPGKWIPYFDLQMTNEHVNYIDHTTLSDVQSRTDLKTQAALLVTNGYKGRKVVSAILAERDAYRDEGKGVIDTISFTAYPSDYGVYPDDFDTNMTYVAGDKAVLGGSYISEFCGKDTYVNLGVTIETYAGICLRRYNVIKANGLDGYFFTFDKASSTDYGMVNDVSKVKYDYKLPLKVLHGARIPVTI